MTFPKSPSAFPNQLAAFGAALASGTVRVRLSTPAEATRWRFAANHFRSLLQKRDGRSPYDHLQLTLDGCEVIIAPRALPEIVTEGGEKAVIPAPAPLVEPAAPEMVNFVKSLVGK